MTKGYMGFSGSSGAVNYGSVRYLTLPYIGKAVQTSESATQLKFAENRAVKMWVKVTAFSLTFGGEAVNGYVRLRKNGVNTSLAVSVNAVGTFVVTADVDVADGDLLDIAVDTQDADGGSVTVDWVGVGFLCQ